MRTLFDSPKQVARKAYEVDSIPTLVVIDREGIVRGGNGHEC